MAQIDITEADLANATLEQWEEDATEAEALSKLQSTLNKWKVEDGPQPTEAPAPLSELCSDKGVRACASAEEDGPQPTEDGPQPTEEELFSRVKVILDKWNEENPLSHLTGEECFARIKAILDQWKNEDEENAKIEASKQKYGYVIYDGKT